MIREVFLQQRYYENLFWNFMSGSKVHGEDVDIYVVLILFALNFIDCKKPLTLNRKTVIMVIKL